MKIIEGQLHAEGQRFGIVQSSFNSMITENLLEGAISCIRRHGGLENNITLLKVPGAFELAIAAQKLAETGTCDAIICLGAIIRGATPHFDYLSAQVTRDIAGLALSTRLPLTYGVLTTDTIEQAIERAGTKVGNKGWDAALAAIEMVSLLRQVT